VAPDRSGLAEGEHIFHLATRADWRNATRTGSYRTSTRGRTLAEEGFIHASRAGQVTGVAQAFYADVDEPLVLLQIDPALLGSKVRLERPVGSDEDFPHIYGPIPTGAVVAATPYVV
jgi:uncharacterized protein (DUF952 family)